MNRSLSYDSPHLLMSNLEPRHTYYIQVAAFTSRGTGPFSETLEVRPEPSLAHLGKVSKSHVRLYIYVNGKSQLRFNIPGTRIRIDGNRISTYNFMIVIIKRSYNYAVK